MSDSLYKKEDIIWQYFANRRLIASSSLRIEKKRLPIQALNLGHSILVGIERTTPTQSAEMLNIISERRKEDSDEEII